MQEMTDDDDDDAKQQTSEVSGLGNTPLRKFRPLAGKRGCPGIIQEVPLLSVAEGLGCLLQPS